MCDPVSLSLLSAGAQGLSGGVNILQQRGQADAAQDLRQRSMLLTGANAREALLHNYRQIGHGRAQAYEQAAFEIQDITDQSMLGRGQAQVSAAAAGLSGNSLLGLYDDFSRLELRRRSAVLRTTELRDIQFQAEMESARAMAYDRMLSSVGGPIAKPDYLGFATGVFGKGAGTFTQASGGPPSGGPTGSGTSYTPGKWFS